VPHASHTWLSSGELSRALADRGVRLSAPTLQRYARQGRLPARLTPGGHYRFDLDEVLASVTPPMPQTRAPSAIEDLLAPHRDAIRAAAARHNGAHVAVFGSFARGDQGPDSDIDFLVDFVEGSSLFDLMRLSDELEILLGRHVDVVSRSALKARDEHILREAIPV